MFEFVVMLVVVGLVAGFLARWIVPGPDPLSLPRTLAIGLGGSFLGGLVGYWLFGADPESTRVWVAGVLGAVTGSVVLLLIDNFISGRKNQLTM